MDIYSSSNATYLVPNGTCLFSLFPCSITITGNLVLIGFYALILGFSAKLISDGAELLLDIGLPAAIIGGVVLPLLGAIPDSVMIIFSGLGDRVKANQELSVGMGTLAGSTIMLLTLPWLGSLILGRVDILNGIGKDETRSKLNIKNLIKQGVTVCPDVTYSAIIMLITTIPFFIIQGADWHFGPKDHGTDPQPSYIKYSALSTGILALIFLLAYLVFQVVYSVASKRKEISRKEAIRAEQLKRQVIKTMYITTHFKNPNKTKSVSEGVDETKPLISADTKKFANIWKNHRSTKTSEEGIEESGSTSEETSNSNVVHTKAIALVKSIFLLVFGVGLVTIFSDPMVDSLTYLTDSSSKNYYNSDDKHGQYIPIPVFYISFIVTPICSNASEIVSSLIFASKMKRVTSSMTFSQLYGAATMNNTLCLMVFCFLVYFNNLNWQFSAGLFFLMTNTG